MEEISHYLSFCDRDMLLHPDLGMPDGGTVALSQRIIDHHEYKDRAKASSAKLFGSIAGYDRS
jgi:hypothetical protein